MTVLSRNTLEDGSEHIVSAFNTPLGLCVLNKTVKADGSLHGEGLTFRGEELELLKQVINEQEDTK